MPRTRMLVSTTALTSARGTPDSLHGSVDHTVDMTIRPAITSASHLVDENAQPHLRRHHSFEKLGLVLHGQRIDALLNCCQSARHGKKCNTGDTHVTLKRRTQMVSLLPFRRRQHRHRHRAQPGRHQDRGLRHRPRPRRRSRRWPNRRPGNPRRRGQGRRQPHRSASEEGAVAESYFTSPPTSPMRRRIAATNASKSGKWRSRTSRTTSTSTSA